MKGHGSARDFATLMWRSIGQKTIAKSGGYGLNQGGPSRKKQVPEHGFFKNGRV